MPLTGEFELPPCLQYMIRPIDSLCSYKLFMHGAPNILALASTHMAARRAGIDPGRVAHIQWLKCQTVGMGTLIHVCPLSMVVCLFLAL